jgi:diguanylate cyclase (GGDEF)-like protein
MSDVASPVRDHWWYRAAYLAVALGAVLLLSTLAGGTAVLLQRTRQSSLESAEARLRNTALVTVNTINRQLLQVDGALASLPALFSSTFTGTGPIDAVEAARLLKAFNFDTFAYRDLLLVGADGRVWASARPRPKDRALPRFPARPATSPGAVAIEGPVVNPLTGEVSWFLARDIQIPILGRFRALAEVPVSFMTALLAPVANVSGLHIDSVRSNGLVLTDLPYDAMRLGKRSPVGLIGRNPPGTVFMRSSNLGSGAVLATWAQTLYPDVNVSLWTDRDVALAEWVRDRSRILLIVTVVGTLIILLSTALIAALCQRESVERERRKSRDMLDDAIEAMSDGFVMWDEAERLVTCNRRYRDMYAVSAPFIKPGASFEEIIREGVRRGQYPQAGENLEAFVQETLAWHRGNHGALERLLPDGRWILVTERHTQSGGTVGIRTDITALKQAQAELQEANQRVRETLAELQVQNQALTERDHAIRTQNVLFTAALNNMSQGLLMVDSDQRLIVCNRRFLEIFVLDARHAGPGTSTVGLLRALEQGGGIGREALAHIFTQQDRIAGRKGAGTFRVFDRDSLALAVAQRPLPDGGWVATYEDVTEQHRAESQIRFMAHHDGLTKLPNRVLFRSRIEEALHQLDQTGASMALLYLDLDKFKYVNDSLGHPVGDALLEAAAKRLSNCVRTSDIVARLGGDEFAIGMISTELPSAATQFAKRVIESLSVPYELGTRRVQVGVSVGIALARDRDADCDMLLKRADMALYQAKANGRGTYAIFADEMEQRLNARLTIEADLRLALEREEFQLVYQPIFALEGGGLCGFEALLRWHHPQRGLISPALFIPWAEELGIINAIGKWTLRRACADLVVLPTNLKVAVNLSPVQLMDCAIIEHVEHALADFDINPARLELEITESALLSNSVATTELLLRFHRLGLSIALDDFGTGYSSLSHLRGFPFDVIKIDQLFVSEMETRADCAAIVSSLANLAGKLGMTTTAEGVETEEQLRLVRDAGCTAVQGYLLGRPQPIAIARQQFLAGYCASSLEHVRA